MTQVTPAALLSNSWLSTFARAHPRLTACLVSVLRHSQTEQSSRCKQLKQTRSGQVGCELAEAEIYLCAKAKFCTGYLWHKPCVQKRDRQEIWAEVVPLPAPAA